MLRRTWIISILFFALSVAVFNLNRMWSNEVSVGKFFYYYYIRMTSILSILFEDFCGFIGGQQRHNQIKFWCIFNSESVQPKHFICYFRNNVWNGLCDSLSFKGKIEHGHVVNVLDCVSIQLSLAHHPFWQMHAVPQLSVRARLGCQSRFANVKRYKTPSGQQTFTRVTILKRKTWPSDFLL